MSTSWCRWLTVPSNKSEDQDVQGSGSDVSARPCLRPCRSESRLLSVLSLARLADRRNLGKFPKGSCELACFSYPKKFAHMTIVAPAARRPMHGSPRGERGANAKYWI